MKVIALVHSQLRHIAQRALHEEVTINPSTVTGAAAVLAQNTQLAKYIQVLVVELGPNTSFSKPFYNSITTAISHMTKLRSLSLSIPADQGSDILPQNSEFPGLHTFAALFSLDRKVFQFLQKAPQLATLDLYGSDGVSRLDHSCRLQEAPPSSTQGRFPQRPSHGCSAPAMSLRIHDLAIKHVFLLAQSSQAVSILDARVSDPLLPVLDALCSELPSLVQFRLTSSYDFWEPMAGDPLLIVSATSVNAIEVSLKTLLAASST